LSLKAVRGERDAPSVSNAAQIYTLPFALVTLDGGHVGGPALPPGE